MGHEQRLSMAERANLVAYLDGELNDAESRALATKLSLSVSARREKTALEKTWELLDYLERPQATDDFVSRTATQATQLGAIDERIASVAGRTMQVVTRLAICAGIACVVVGITYAATRWLWPDPSARLIRELSIAEHFDEYRDVGSFEFLKQLDELPAFNEDAK
jgi:hypothetical protein